MKSENKNMKRGLLLMGMMVLLLTGTMSAQNLNTFGSNVIPNQTVDPKIDFLGGLEGSVQPSSGVYGVSQKLGTITTACDISYDLMISYSSKVSVGMEEPNIKGLPFGEGWSLDIPRISIINEGFAKLNPSEMITYESFWSKKPIDRNPTDPNYTGISLTESDYYHEGRPMFTVSDISIPGVCSGRFVYKGIGSTLSDYSNGLVFVPMNFDRYMEAILVYGERNNTTGAITEPYWVVVTDDGTLYEFKKEHRVYMNAPNQRGEGDFIFNKGLNNVFKHNYLPKKTYDSWYCTKIIYQRYQNCTFTFHYKTFGSFNEHENFVKQEYLVEQQLNGNNYTPPGETWRDIYLDKITTEIQSLEIQYNDDLKSQIANTSGNTDPNKYIDAMYYKEKVTIPTGGKRLLHQKSAKGLKCNGSENEGGYGTEFYSNPYINPGDQDYNGTFNSFAAMNIMTLSDTRLGSADNVEGTLAYNAGAYISPDISLNNLVAGDLYVLDYEVTNTNAGANALLDVSIVANELSVNEPNISTNPGDVSIINSKCYDSRWSKEIYNTFNSGVKDFVNLAGPNQYRNFKHYFTMPSLASLDHNAIQIRVGPANADMQMNWGLVDEYTYYSPGPQYLYFSSPTFWKYTGSNNEVNTAPYGKYSSPPQNFGIGTPWYALSEYYDAGGANGFYNYPYWYNQVTSSGSHCHTTTISSRPTLPLDYEITYSLYRLVKMPLVATTVVLKNKSDLSVLEKVTLEYKVESKTRNISYIAPTTSQGNVFFNKTVNGNINYVLLDKVRFWGKGTSPMYSNSFKYQDVGFNNDPSSTQFTSPSSGTYFAASERGVPRKGYFPILKEYNSYLGKKTTIEYYSPYKKNTESDGSGGIVDIEFGSKSEVAISPVVLSNYTRRYTGWTYDVFIPNSGGCVIPERYYVNTVCDFYMRVKTTEVDNGSSTQKFIYTYGSDYGAIEKVQSWPKLFGANNKNASVTVGDRISNKKMIINGPYVAGVSLGTTEYEFYTDIDKFGKIKTKTIKDKNNSSVLSESYTYKVESDYRGTTLTSNDWLPPSQYLQLSTDATQGYAGLYDLIYTKFHPGGTDDVYFKPKFVGLERIDRVEYYPSSNITSSEEFEYYNSSTMPNTGMYGCYLLKSKKITHPSLSQGYLKTTYKYVYNDPAFSTNYSYILGRTRQVALKIQETTEGEVVSDVKYTYSYSPFSFYKFVKQENKDIVTNSYITINEVKGFDITSMKPAKYRLNKDIKYIEANYTQGLLINERYPHSEDLPADYRKIEYDYNTSTRKMNYSKGYDGLKNVIMGYDDFYRPYEVRYSVPTLSSVGKSSMTYAYDLSGGTGGQNEITRVPVVSEGYSIKSKFRFNGDGQIVGGTKNGLLDYFVNYDEAGRVIRKLEPGGRDHMIYKYKDMPIERLESSRSMSWGAGETVNVGAYNGLTYTEVIDEDGKKTREYKDALGRVVVKSNYDDWGNEMKTVYTYNSCGQIASIKQPTTMSTNGEEATFTYDGECRLKEKRGFGESAPHKYDYTTTNEIAKHTYPDGTIDEYFYTDYYRELKKITRTKGGSSVDIKKLYYGPSGSISSGKVNKTEEWVEVAPGSYQMISMEVKVWDNYGRPSQVEYHNINNSVDVVNYTYDGLDNVLTETRTHTMPSLTSFQVKKTVEYDMYARRSRAWLKVGLTNEKLIDMLEYDDQYGTIRRRNIGQATTFPVTYLQKQDYRYNSRGWLTNINTFNECQNTSIPPESGGEVTSVKKTQVDVITKQTDVGLGKQTEMKVEMTSKLLVGATPVYSAKLMESSVLFDKGEPSTTSGTDTTRVIYYGEMDEWTVAGQLAQTMTGKVPNNTVIYYNQKGKMDTSTYLQNRIKDAVVILNGKTRPCNPVGLSGGDLFAQELNYNSVNPKYTGYQVYYNGNISMNRWVTVGDANIRSYSYTYNNTNQMLNAIYKEKGYQSTDNPIPSKEGLYDEKVTYHTYGESHAHVGNIKTLQRFAPNTSGSQVQIDNLSYSYANNRLSGVSESSDATRGFKLSTTYTYDNAGNVTADNQNIVSITYNANNQPVRVILANNIVINNYYTPDGQKVGYDFTKDKATTYHYYINGIEYENSDVKFITHEEGRYVVNSISGGELTGRWEYVLRDHQGNARIHFSDVNNDGVVTVNESIQESYQKFGYYPYGMQYDKDVYPFPNTLDNVVPKMRYRYTGYEDLKDIDFEVYDANARLYNPYIGRFFETDKFTINYSQRNSYNYAANNPIKYIDVNGDSLDIYNPNGQYVRTEDDGKKGYSGIFYQSSTKDKNGNIIYSDGVSFTYNDPIEDRKYVNEEGYTIQLASMKDIQSMLLESRNSEVKYPYKYAKKEGGSGGKMDFFGQNPDRISVFTLSIIRDRMGTAVSYNPNDYGNFMFGLAMRFLDIPLSIAKLGAHYNNMFSGRKDNSNLRWRLLDSIGDQRAIENGYYFTVKPQIKVR